MLGGSAELNSVGVMFIQAKNRIFYCSKILLTLPNQSMHVSDPTPEKLCKNPQVAKMKKPILESIPLCWILRFLVQLCCCWNRSLIQTQKSIQVTQAFQVSESLARPNWRSWAGFITASQILE